MVSISKYYCYRPGMSDCTSKLSDSEARVFKESSQ